MKDKNDWELRNGLTHGLVWIDGLTIRYSKDIESTEQGEIRLDDLWKRANNQSKVTRCLINLVPAWCSADC